MLYFPGAQHTSIKMLQFFHMQELKMQLFRESLCMQELKVFQFPGSCDFQGFVHARLQSSAISWDFVRAARRASLSSVHERAPNAARSASLSRRFCAWKGRDASITGSKCFNCQGFKCPNFPRLCVKSLEHLSALPAWFQNRPFWANFDPAVGDPSCQINPLFLQSIFRERTRSNMYTFALTYLIPGEYNMYIFSARW